MNAGWPVVALLAALLLWSGSARAAELEVVPGSLSARAFDAAGQPERRAGAHPDRLRVALALNAEETGRSMKDMVMELPAGLVGDIGAAETCPRRVFDQLAFGNLCPAGSQVGTGVATIQGFGELNFELVSVEPAPGQLAAVGFSFLAKFPFWMGLRSTDYGLSLEQRDLIQILPFTDLEVDLWGVPADHQEEGSSLPRRPFLTLPTRCGEPLEVSVRVRAWGQGTRWSSARAEDELPLGGCEDLPFAPSFEFDLSESKVDSPTGARLDLIVPQNEDPDGLASSHLRSATVELPVGTTISPGAAEGLVACTDAQLRPGTDQPSSCPTTSRVGSLELTGSQLREAVEGTVYVGEERPGDRFRIFAVAAGAGVDAKLIGSLRVDPVSGRLRTVLSNLPQLPFERLSMRFDGGPGALLASPLRCGPAVAAATFDPYSGSREVEATDGLTIEPTTSGPCPAEPAFAPRVVAGTASARAGRSSAFSIALSRSDGEATPDRFAVRFPPGLTASVAGVEKCDGAAAAANRCSAAARIGSAVAEFGSGGNPAALRGDAFLTGPYRGAPFGLAMSFPARLGPFDLGTVAVRSALRFDPLTGAVTVETDSLPSRIEGLPIRLRSLALTIDRPGMLRNPTSCEPSAVGVSVSSSDGRLSRTDVPFFVRGCHALGFRPRVSLALTGRSRPSHGARPGLRIGLRPRPGDANLRGVDILLPRALGFDSSGLSAICSLRDAGRGECPVRSRVGSARARSRLLDRPLRGSVYIAQPPGSGLPDLWTVLAGDDVRLFVRSRVAVVDGRARARLIGLPDVPLSSLELRLTGGEHGLFSLTKPCVKQHRSSAVLEGHDGAVRIARPPIGRLACRKGRGG